MAKKPRVTCKITFVTDVGVKVVDNITYVPIDVGVMGLKYFQLERKGNGWLLLHTDGMLFHGEPRDIVIDIMREGFCQTNNCSFLIDDRPHAVTRYTTISTINKSEFYHFDELDDHTYRITHGLGFFNGAKWVSPTSRKDEHNAIKQIKVEFQ